MFRFVREENTKSQDGPFFSIIYFACWYKTKKIGYIVRIGGKHTKSVKWEARHSSGLRYGQLHTRKEAAEYLYELHRNREATKRLAELRTSAYSGIVGVDGDDGGLYDVLCSFATGIGYEIHTKPWKEEPTTVFGRILYSEKMIWVRQDQPPLMKAATLAHELAHIYTYVPCDGINNVMEQVTEAVSAMILREYGLDTRQSALEYILYHTTSTRRQNWFFGGLDTLTIACYTAFSRDLRDFIAKGDASVPQRTRRTPTRPRVSYRGRNR